MYEHRHAVDTERLKQLESQLKKACIGAEETDHKHDEVCCLLFLQAFAKVNLNFTNYFVFFFKLAKKVAEVKDDLERAEERVLTSEV